MGVIYCGDYIGSYGVLQVKIQVVTKLTGHFTVLQSLTGRHFQSWIVSTASVSAHDMHGGPGSRHVPSLLACMFSMYHRFTHMSLFVIPQNLIYPLYNPLFAPRIIPTDPYIIPQSTYDPV